MKNKKGFTLVELLVVIGLLALFGVSIGITLNRNIKKQQETNMQDFINKVKGAANLYASNNEDILTNLYEDKGYVIIKLNDLIDKGLLSENLINPETNEEVTGEENIKIELDDSGTINIDFPVIDPNGDYLQTQAIIIEYGSSIEDFCYKGLDTESLRYIEASGNVKTGYLNKDVNIKCNSERVDITKIGTYEIEYEYKITNGTWKRATRDVIVMDSSGPRCGTQTPNPTTWLKTARTINIQCEDNTGCLNNVETKTFSNTRTGTITITDISNNTTNCTVNVYSDSNAPTNVNLTSSKSGWTKDDVVLTGSGMDNLSGIKYYQFSSSSNLTNISTTGTEITPTTNSISYTKTISDNTNSTYYFYVQDEVGNITKSNSVNVNIDKVTPTVNIKAIKEGTTTEVSTNTWSDKGLNFTLTNGTIGASGATIKYCKDTKNTCTPNTTVTSGSKITNYNTTTGEYYIRYQIISGAGIESTIGSYHAKVDTGMPTVKVTAYKYISSGTHKGTKIKNEETYASNSTYTINSNWIDYGVYLDFASSAISGIKSITWKWNSAGSATDTNNNYPSSNAQTSPFDNKSATITAAGYRKAQWVVTSNANKTVTITVVVKIDTCSETQAEYGKWLDWGECSKQCGNNGTQSRTRSVTNKSKFGNFTCSTDTDTETQECNRRDCCSKVTYRDGTTCTKTCGGGTYNRLAYSEYDGSRCSSKDETSGGSACNNQACDSTPPSISVSVSSGTTYAKSRGATVTISDSGSGLAAGTYTIKYAWGTSTVACSNMSSSINITAAKGDASKTGTIPAQTDYTGAGKIYICNSSAIKDANGNTLNANNTANANMYLDNTGPIITFGTNGSSSTINTASTTVTVADSHNGSVKNLKYAWSTSNTTTPTFSSTFTNGQTITKTGVSGAYYLWIYAEDNLGNSRISKSNAFNLSTNYCITVKSSVGTAYVYWDANLTNEAFGMNYPSSYYSATLENGKYKVNIYNTYYTATTGWDSVALSNCGTQTTPSETTTAATLSCGSRSGISGKIGTSSTMGCSTDKYCYYWRQRTDSCFECNSCGHSNEQVASNNGYCVRYWCP